MEKELGHPLRDGLSSQAMEPQASPPKALIPDADKRDRFYYSYTFNGEGSVWLISKKPDGRSYALIGQDEVVFEYQCDGYGDELEPPQPVRDKYEELIEYNPHYSPSSRANLVEMIADEDEVGFNQACRFGSLVEGHAVYCHNDKWLYGPRKCRRTWYTGGEVRDEDCEGFEPSPNAHTSQ